jgi:hypothetical protein
MEAVRWVRALRRKCHRRIVDVPERPDARAVQDDVVGADLRPPGPCRRRSATRAVRRPATTTLGTHPAGQRRLGPPPALLRRHDVGRHRPLDRPTRCGDGHERHPAPYHRPLTSKKPLVDIPRLPTDATTAAPEAQKDEKGHHESPRLKRWLSRRRWRDPPGMGWYLGTPVGLPCALVGAFGHMSSTRVKLNGSLKEPKPGSAPTMRWTSWPSRHPHAAMGVAAGLRGAGASPTP